MADVIVTQFRIEATVHLIDRRYEREHFDTADDALAFAREIYGEAVVRKGENHMLPPLKRTRDEVPRFVISFF